MKHFKKKGSGIFEVLFATGQILLFGAVLGAISYIITYLSRKLINKYHVGGFNILKRNVRSKQQFVELKDGINKSWTNSSTTISDLPIIIATDQEGGSVVRFNFLDELTSQNKIVDEAMAYDVAKRRGVELCAIGVNAVFSPVVDLVTDRSSYLYGRTFGTTSSEIPILSSAMIKGYKDAGVLAIAKHYPGYGNTILDPHQKVVVNGDKGISFDDMVFVWNELINLTPPEAIMSAHVTYSDVGNRPATFSDEVINGVLRNEIGWEGVVITDDIEMGGVGSGEIGELAVEAINAGNDMIIDTFNSENHIKILEALNKAVSVGALSLERLDEAVTRIIIMKLEMGDCNHNSDL